MNDMNEVHPPSIVETLRSAELHTLLAHRFPFLLVDRVDVIVPGQLVVGHKRVSGGEWWAESMAAAPAPLPFGLVIEAMAQTSGALMRNLAGAAEGAVAYFMGVNRARLRGSPLPGDELVMELSLRQWRRGICRTRGVATAGGRLVASAELTTVIRSDPAPH